MTTAFIGLGRMGGGMARNLLRAQGGLLVHDANAAAAAAFAKEGAEVAADVADVARRADLVFISLPGPPEVEQVVFGENGLLAHLRPGATLFDLSTNSLRIVRRAHEALAKKGVAFLDAPVSGGPAGAASGDLVLWIGGDKAAYDRALPALQAFSRHPRHVGAIGAGTVTKLAHNMLGYSIMQAEAEVFSMAVKAGVDPLDLWEALRLGMVGKASPLNMLVNQFLPGVYDKPAFAMRLAQKDVTLATELGRELGVPMRLANLTHAEMTEALARGMGDMDSRAYLQLQLERAGVTIAVAPERIAAAVRVS